MKKLFLIVISIIFAASMLVVYSQTNVTKGKGGMSAPPPMMRGFSRIPSADMILMMSGTLKLSNTQSSKIKSIKANTDKSMASLFTKMQKASTPLRNEIYAAKYNENNVKKQYAQIRAVETEMTNLNISTWTKIRKVLTADQITKLRSMSNQPRMGNKAR